MHCEDTDEETSLVDDLQNAAVSGNAYEQSMKSEVAGEMDDPLAIRRGLSTHRCSPHADDDLLTRICIAPNWHRLIAMLSPDFAEALTFAAHLRSAQTRKG